MRFECTEDVIKDEIGGVFTVMKKGDVKTVPDGWGQYAVETRGWGKDLDEVYTQAERKPGAVTLTPDDVVQRNS